MKELGGPLKQLVLLGCRWQAIAIENTRTHLRVGEVQT